MVSLLSRFQAEEILKAQRRGESFAETSLDLGRSKSSVFFDGEFLILPDGERMPLATLKDISGDSTCFMVEGGETLKLQFFLPDTKRFYRLVATGSTTPPTAEVSGIRMHRTKDVNPWEDTLAKVNSIKPFFGRVLDTCTGLGYTAIAALKAGASDVHTVEEDRGMMQLSEINPWSKELFEAGVTRINGDVLEKILDFDDGFFSAAIHDPPRMSLAGKLYSLEFYRQLHRVLKNGGKVFHYVGSPGSRYRNKKPVAGVVKRLREAGFVEVEVKPQAQGVVARK